MSERFDADELVARMRADRESDWPDRLLAALRKKPLLDESEIGSYRYGQSDELTEAEIAVLRCVSRGMSRDDAAIILGRSLETVKSQLISSRRKLKAKNTGHAACEAIRRGLIP